MKKEANIKYTKNRFITSSFQQMGQGTFRKLMTICKSQNVRLYATFIPVKRELSKITF